MIEKRFREGEATFFRSMMFPEEERRRYTSQPWDGSFRWFKAENVLCRQRPRGDLGLGTSVRTIISHIVAPIAKRSNGRKFAAMH